MVDLQKVVSFFGRLTSPANMASFYRTRGYLEHGLLGDAEAKKEYERRRLFSRSNLPDWANKELETIASKNSLMELRKTDLSKTARKGEVSYKIQRTSLPRIRRALRYSTFFSFSRAFRNAERMRSSYERALQRVESKPSSNFRYNQLMFRSAVYRGAEEMARYMAKVITLQDFLYLHPVLLKDHEMVKIVRDSKDHWDIINHPTVKRLFAAEQQLQDVFTHFSLTPEERAAAISLLLKKSIGITKKGIIAVLEEESGHKMPLPEAPAKPKLLKVAEPTPEVAEFKPISAKKLVKQFLEKNLLHLGKDERSLVARRVVQLDSAGLMNAEESLEKLKSYLAKDHSHFMEMLYHDLVRPEAPILETPQEKTTQVPQLKPLETTETIIDRVNFSNRIRYYDILELKRRLARNQVEKNLVPEAIKHTILFELAKGGKRQRRAAKRILLDSVVSAYVPNNVLAEGKNVVEKMVSDGLIVRRETEKTPGPLDNVKINPDLLYKYRHGE